MEFAENLRGNGYKVLKVWNGDISDNEVSDWHHLNRKGEDTAKVSEKNVKSDGKIYVANTYIFRNDALRHNSKEFDTAVAAYKYLHKKNDELFGSN